MTRFSSAVLLFVVALSFFSLTSCSREEAFKPLVPVVKVMTDNGYYSTVTYNCPEQSSSCTYEVNFKVAYVVHIGRIINDINEEFKFYAMKDGIKYAHDDALVSYINSSSLEIVNIMVANQIPYSDQVTVYIPYNNDIYDYTYHIDYEGTTHNLEITEIY